MPRNPLQLRDATSADASALIEVWADLARPGPTDRTPVASREAATEKALERIAADPDERLVVAVLDDTVVGAVHLRVAPLSPIHEETAIHVTHLHVIDRCRRHGIGRALVSSAVAWAEDRDITHVLAAISATSRDANRFMARLGLGQLAVVRGSTVAALRAKLPVEAVAVRAGHRAQRNVAQVVAERRSQRRARARFG